MRFTAYIGGTAYTLDYAPSTINTWNYYAATFSNNTMTLYFNGSSVGTATHTGSLSSSTNALYLGSTGTANYLLGYLDEVRVYSSALALSDIAALYNQAALSVTSVTHGTVQSFALIPGTSGINQYSDATYKFTGTTISQYTGATFIQTASADYNSTSSQLVSFTTNTPCVVYVLYDSLLYGTAHQAGWVSGFTDTGTTVTNSHGHTFKLLKKVLPAGTFWLGGNTSDGSTIGDMYTVFFQPLCWNSTTSSVT